MTRSNGVVQLGGGFKGYGKPLLGYIGDETLPSYINTGIIINHNWVVAAPIFFWTFHPENWGRKFTNLTVAYFSDGLVQPPTSLGKHGGVIQQSFFHPLLLVKVFLGGG